MYSLCRSVILINRRLDLHFTYEVLSFVHKGLNMKKLYFQSLLIICCLIILTGCYRMYNYGCRRFNQGCDVEECLEIPRCHTRSTRVYDQLSTLGIFHAMWLSDEVRCAYVNLVAQKYSGSDKEASLTREREQTKRFISFYLLASYPDECGDRLDQSNSAWIMFLKIGDFAYKPKSIKKVDLPCEYQLFFGKVIALPSPTRSVNGYYNRFSEVYLVQFDALDAEGKPLLDNVSTMVLCFHVLDRQTYVEWKLDCKGKLVCENLICNETCREIDVCKGCNNLQVSL